MIERNISGPVYDTLEEDRKMVFLSGPRQVGKTTLARRCQEKYAQSLYFNWDTIPDQKKLLKDPYFFEKENRDARQPFLVVWDEIHKYARWRNYLKGAYDRFQNDFRFLVTGSGRLELFKKGGDSLLGRYLGLPLHPLTVGELVGTSTRWDDFKQALQNLPSRPAGATDACDGLFRFSGFPEPFLRARVEFYNRWFEARKTLLLREDIRDASRLREISLLEMLSHLIPDRVGSPLSLNALKQDIGVAFETVRDWVLLLEQFFYLFRVYPFAGSLKRSLRKEAKAYLYDWAEVSEEGPRFENMTALHLLKAVQIWRSTGQGAFALHYIRDKEKREVDFAIVEKGRPVCLVECKRADEEPAPALLYFQAKLAVPVAVQLVHKKGVCKRLTYGGRMQWIVSADHWLSILP
jgi:uncharacterized protein